MTDKPETYQATAVTIGDRAILIEGPSGVGKSTLALSLIDRGATLIGDDGVLLELNVPHLYALPHPNTKGLIEVRNIGLVTLPVRDKARICLVLRLDLDAPRFVDGPEWTRLLGVDLPLILLHPEGPNLVIKAELALEKFALQHR